jgi:hypothetical protein
MKTGRVIAVASFEHVGGVPPTPSRPLTDQRCRAHQSVSGSDGGGLLAESGTVSVDVVPLAPLKGTGSDEQTIIAYVLPRIGHVELSKVDGAMLNALYGDLLTNGRTGASGRSGGLSAKSVRNVHGMMHKAFKDAVRWRRLAANPCDAADQPRRSDT